MHFLRVVDHHGLATARVPCGVGVRHRRGRGARENVPRLTDPGLGAHVVWFPRGEARKPAPEREPAPHAVDLLQHRDDHLDRQVVPARSTSGHSSD